MFRKYYKLSIIPISFFLYNTIKEIDLKNCICCSFICVTDTRNCLYCIKDILSKK